MNPAVREGGSAGITPQRFEGTADGTRQVIRVGSDVSAIIFESMAHKAAQGN